MGREIKLDGGEISLLKKIGLSGTQVYGKLLLDRIEEMENAEFLDTLTGLIDQGYVLQREGAHDRRQRLLYVTPKGEALAMKLAGLQTARIARALTELGPNAHEAACRFLSAMINAEHRESVLRFIARADRARRQRG